MPLRLGYWLARVCPCASGSIDCSCEWTISQTHFHHRLPPALVHRCELWMRRAGAYNGHMVAASTPTPQAPRYIQGSSPQAPKATLGSVPCACVLACSLHIKRPCMWRGYPVFAPVPVDLSTVPVNGLYHKRTFTAGYHQLWFTAARCERLHSSVNGQMVSPCVLLCDWICWLFLGMNYVVNAPSVVCLYVWPVSLFYHHQIQFKGVSRECLHGSVNGLAFTGYCHCQYCVVYITITGGRGETLYCAIVWAMTGGSGA